MPIFYLNVIFSKSLFFASSCQKMPRLSWNLDTMCKNTRQKKLSERFWKFLNFGEILGLLRNNFLFLPKNLKILPKFQNFQNRPDSFFCLVFLHIVSKFQLNRSIFWELDAKNVILRKSHFSKKWPFFT